MRKLLIAAVAGIVLVVAGLSTAARIRQGEPAGRWRCDLRGLADLPRFAWESLGRLAALARRNPPVPPGPDSVPTPADTEPRFAYSVGGGFNGEGGDDVTITSAGKVTRTSPDEPLPDTWSISSSQVAQLTALFNRLGFLRMRTTKDLYPRCPDAFTYIVAYRFRGRMNTVTADQGGEQKHRFWKCLSALSAVVGERRRVVGEKTPAGLPARIDSVTVDGRPVIASSTVVVDSGPHRISWRGVAREGCTVTDFAIAIRRGQGDFADCALHCPVGDYDYTFPASGGPCYVTPVVYFSDSTYSAIEFEVVPEQSVGGMDRLMLSPHGGVTVLPPDRWKESERNRVAVAIDGKPVARRDTVRLTGGRSYRISWQGIAAGGCRPLKLRIAIQTRRNGRVLARADNCPDGYYDFTFPVSNDIFWVVPEVFFTDYTWAWGDFFAATSEQP